MSKVSIDIEAIKKMKEVKQKMNIGVKLPLYAYYIYLMLTPEQRKKILNMVKQYMTELIENEAGLKI